LLFLLPHGQDVWILAEVVLHYVGFIVFGAISAPEDEIVVGFQVLLVVGEVENAFWVVDIACEEFSGVVMT
jgi:hypothetical protein